MSADRPPSRATSSPPPNAPGAAAPPPPPTLSIGPPGGVLRSEFTPDSAGSLSPDSLAPSPASAGALSPGAALVLMHDDAELTPDSPYFEFSDEDEDDADTLHPYLERVRASAVPPLSPALVFLYMVAPAARLGALLVPADGLPLKISIPLLVFFGVLSGFARQIWYMLARYVGKADMEEILVDTFARGRGREEMRQVLRRVVKGFTGVWRVLLAAIYLRGTIYMLVIAHVANFSPCRGCGRCQRANTPLPTVVTQMAHLHSLLPCYRPTLPRNLFRVEDHNIHHLDIHC
jgi:hypothetical protein